MVPSLLDRLVDWTPGQEDHPAIPCYEQETTLMASLRRDLTGLLNVRRAAGMDFGALQIARESVINYGLADFTSYGLQQADRRLQVGALLAECLRRFEPRLENVEVVVMDGISTDLTTHFRVTGQLGGSSKRENICFSAFISAGSTHCQIAKE